MEFSLPIKCLWTFYCLFCLIRSSIRQDSLILLVISKKKAFCFCRQRRSEKRFPYRDMNQDGVTAWVILNTYQITLSYIPPPTDQIDVVLKKHFC